MKPAVKDTWFEDVVAMWLKGCAELDYKPEDIEAARVYIDGNYSDDFEYPEHYFAMRAFYMQCAAWEKNDHTGKNLLASPIFRAIACVERAYRMGHAMGYAKAHETPKPRREVADEKA